MIAAAATWRSVYDGAAWDSGPSLLYDRLAAAALASAGVALNGALVVDLAAGTGAVSRAVVAGGGRAVAVDVSAAMVSRAQLVAWRLGMAHLAPFCRITPCAGKNSAGGRGGPSS